MSMPRLPKVVVQEAAETPPPGQDLRFFREGQLQGFLEVDPESLSFSELVSPEGQLLFLRQPITVTFQSREGPSTVAECKELSCSGTGTDRYLAYRDLCMRILSHPHDAQLACWLPRTLLTQRR